MTEKAFLKQHYEQSLEDREWLMFYCDDPNAFEQDILDRMKNIEDLQLGFLNEEENMEIKSTLLSAYRRLFLKSYLKRTGKSQ